MGRERQRDGNVSRGGEETGCRNFAFYGDGRLRRRINKLAPHTYGPSDRRKIIKAIIDLPELCKHAILLPVTVK